MFGLWAFVCPNESQLTSEDVLKSDIFEIRNSIFHLVKLQQVRVYLLICKMFHEGLMETKLDIVYCMAELKNTSSLQGSGYNFILGPE